VYVFNLNDNMWYRTKYDKNNLSFMGISIKFLKFEVTNTPILTKEFAGIGTRKLNDAGKKAIESVFEKTYKYYIEIKKIKDFFSTNIKIPYKFDNTFDYSKLIITIEK